MKRSLFILIPILIMFYLTGICCKPSEKQSESGGLEGTISISGAWALYPLAVSWADQFKQLHPGVRIEISAGGAGKGMADVLSDLVDLAMVSREIYPQEIEQGAFYVPVAIDAVVPVINAENPVIGLVKSKGIKREIFEKIWIQGESLDWGNIYDEASAGRINVYTRSDACGAAATFAAFMGKKQEDMLGTGIFGDPGMVTAVKDDTLGIGYNNINFVYDRNTKNPVDGVSVIPIDLNGNGILDENEDFYENIDLIVKAISEGNYPSPPARELYFVTKGKPPEGLVKEFLEYVLSEGQALTSEAGYVNISQDKIDTSLDKLR